MIGAMIWRVKAAGRSLAIIEAIRNPLRGYYASLIETKVLPGPNPAADLRYFIGKGAHRKARRHVATFFAQEVELTRFRGHPIVGAKRKKIGRAHV